MENWNVQNRPFKQHLYTLLEEVKKNKEDAKLMTERHEFYYNFEKEVEIFIEMWETHLEIRPYSFPFIWTRVKD